MDVEKSRSGSLSSQEEAAIDGSTKKNWPKNPKTQQFILMSSIYAQLLVVICVVFFTSEIVTPRVPLFYFEGFYVFLYSMSLLFLLYVYTYLLREPPSKPARRVPLFKFYFGSKEPSEPSVASSSNAACPSRVKKHRISENDRSHGSLFLRIGAIAFGLGTMVYNGLEFGSFFEIPSTSPCYSILLGINPVLQMMFTFAQMYFIFANARSIATGLIFTRWNLMVAYFWEFYKLVVHANEFDIVTREWLLYSNDDQDRVEELVVDPSVISAAGSHTNTFRRNEAHAFDTESASGRNVANY